MDRGELAAPVCSALPAGGIVLPAVLFVSGWVLMTAAMMLPTALPLLVVFGRLTRERDDAGRLMALAIGGYALVWLGFGVAAHLVGLGVVALARQSLWLTVNGWVVGVALLLAAGLFQLSRLKYRCSRPAAHP